MRYGHFVMSLFCAWVLWSNVHENDVWRWDIVSALDNREACIDYLRKSMPDPKDKNFEIISEGVINFDNPKYGKFSAIYHCLPDTVDPRAPKGK